MSKKKSNRKTGVRIVKPNSENYTFLSQNNILPNSEKTETQGFGTNKKIEKLRHNSKDIKFNYRSQKIRTKQGHSPVYE
ncbi:hypothetical protein [Candidatus Nitrosotenuis uzonensis]|nr:hypothetical protein [Candidatus Nitrosotenuis uzonensis]